jgi:hypothetical protein
MEKKIAELTKPEYKFDLMLSEDGSGRGAALVAAVATKQEIRRKISMEQMGYNVGPIEPVNRKNSRMEMNQMIAQLNATNLDNDSNNNSKNVQSSKITK